ncbi:MAG TPA: ATP-binding protein [Vicinamibacterales bacterium]|nr:ATP-binding protein [Vicinamibacterales bacterium]
MTSTLANRLARRSISGARIVNVCVAGAAILVLAGWASGDVALTSLYLPGPTMKTNAAVCALCSALASLIFLAPTERRLLKGIGLGLAVVAGAIGGLTLSEHIAGWDLGIDQLIFREMPGAVATASPNRMGPPASLAHVLLCVSLLLSETGSPRRRTQGQFIALFVCVITVLSLIGFAYGVDDLYDIARVTGISLANSLVVLALAYAAQAGRPDAGLAALMCREDEVGVFARRLLPAAVVLPFGIGWALARMIESGIIDGPFAVSAMALVLILVLLLIIWRTGTQLIESLDARAATERALSESERTVRESDRQKTEFLATLSHELRNPLAPIRFAVELLKRPGPAAERARQTIDRQVRHLTRLIDDLLDLTRVTGGKLQLHVRPSEVSQLVQDAVDGVGSEIARLRHRLTIDLPPQPVWLMTDPDRAIQMLVNLLTNAARYSDPGGSITIGAAIDKAHVTISVRDTGQGLAAADLTRVFDRFVQVGPNRQGGLGIGLALVKALAELHGGDVEARSDGLGLGSEFRLRLPRAMTPPATVAETELTPTTSCRILVVDDNEDAAEMLNGMLLARGHQVAVAHNGEDALRTAATFNPQVGLLDLSMPGLDGYELATRLRAMPEFRDMLLVAITGWGQEEDRRRALAAGFDAHLTKPADPVAIAALLAKAGTVPGTRDSAAG